MDTLAVVGHEAIAPNEKKLGLEATWSLRSIGHIFLTADKSSRLQATHWTHAPFGMAAGVLDSRESCTFKD